MNDLEKLYTELVECRKLLKATKRETFGKVESRLTVETSDVISRLDLLILNVLESMERQARNGKGADDG